MLDIIEKVVPTKYAPYNSQTKVETFSQMFIEIARVQKKVMFMLLNHCYRSDNKFLTM